MTHPSAEGGGPFEAGPGPETLDARVLDPPRVHGYDLEADLAEHYRFTDAIFLAATGELPDERASRAFEIACHFAAVLSAGAAGAHVASLVHLCAAGPHAVVGAAATVLADGARDVVLRHRPWLAWLRGPDGAARPDGFGASTDAERRSVAELRARLGGAPRGTDGDPSRDAALLAALVDAGVRADGAIVLVLAWARLPLAVAEGLATPPKRFASYPMRLPRWEYEESR